MKCRQFILIFALVRTTILFSFFFHAIKNIFNVFGLTIYNKKNTSLKNIENVKKNNKGKTYYQAYKEKTVKEIVLLL